MPHGPLLLPARGKLYYFSIQIPCGISFLTNRGFWVILYVVIFECFHNLGDTDGPQLLPLFNSFSPTLLFISQKVRLHDGLSVFFKFAFEKAGVRQLWYLLPLEVRVVGNTVEDFLHLGNQLSFSLIIYLLLFVKSFLSQLKQLLLEGRRDLLAFKE